MPGNKFSLDKAYKKSSEAWQTSTEKLKKKNGADLFLQVTPALI